MLAVRSVIFLSVAMNHLTKLAKTPCNIVIESPPQIKKTHKLLLNIENLSRRNFSQYFGAHACQNINTFCEVSRIFDLFYF